MVLYLKGVEGCPTVMTVGMGSGNIKGLFPRDLTFGVRALGCLWSFAGHRPGVYCGAASSGGVQVGCQDDDGALKLCKDVPLLLSIRYYSILYFTILY